MYILTIETTGKLGSCAVFDTDSDRITVKSCDEPMGHLRNLMNLISEAVNEAGIKRSELGAVAVSVGPGSYTGIRIGVSTARALAQALEIPCISLLTLEIFKKFSEEGKPIAVIFNARRGQVYGAVFGEKGEDILKPGPYMLMDVIEAVKKANINPVFYGDGIDAYANNSEYADLLKGYTFADEKERYQDAELCVDFAKQKALRNEFCTVEECIPCYMRMTEAEQKLADGSLERARAAKMAKFMGR